VSNFGDLEQYPNCGGELENHCGDPGAAGAREDLHALGSAGPGAAASARSWLAVASGLTVSIHRH